MRSWPDPMDFVSPNHLAFLSGPVVSGSASLGYGTTPLPKRHASPATRLPSPAARHPSPATRHSSPFTRNAQTNILQENLGNAYVPQPIKTLTEHHLPRFNQSAVIVARPPSIQKRRPTPPQRQRSDVIGILDYWSVGITPSLAEPPPTCETVNEHDFFVYKPYDIRFKLALEESQYCFQFNNVNHMEFRIANIESNTSPNLTKLRLLEKLNYIDPNGQNPFMEGVSKTRTKMFRGRIKDEGSQIDTVIHMVACPDHALGTLKQIRAIFYAYYFTFKFENAPCLSYVGPPTIFKEQTDFKESSKHFSFPEQQPYLVTFYEMHTPLNIALQDTPSRFETRFAICQGILQMMDTNQKAGLICLDLRLENIAYVQESYKLISLAYSISFISLGVYKQAKSLYQPDSLVDLVNRLLNDRPPRCLPPELASLSDNYDFRSLERYQLGLLLVQIVFDIRTWVELDDRIDSIIDLVKQDTAEPMQSLNVMLRQLLSPNESDRFAQNYSDWVTGQPNLFNLPPLKSRQRTLQGTPLRTQRTPLQTPPRTPLKTPPRSPLLMSQHSLNDKPQPAISYHIKVATPSQHVRPASVRNITEAEMQAIRLRNEVAESYYQMFHYLEALEEWEVLLPDVRECFGTENIEYGYVLERIWLAASKLNIVYKLEQVVEMYLKYKYSAQSRTYQERLDLANVIRNQAMIKEKLSRFGEAITFYKEAALQFQRLRGKFNNTTAEINASIGAVYQGQSDTDKAKHHYELSIYMFTKIQTANEEDTHILDRVDRLKFWYTLHCYSKLLIERRETQEALNSLALCRDLFESISKDRTEHQTFLEHHQLSLVENHRMSAELAMQADDSTQALAAIRMAIATTRNEPARPAHLALQQQQCQLMIKLGMEEEAMKEFGRWARTFQNIHQYCSDTAHVLRCVADEAYKIQKKKIAFKFYSESLAIYRHELNKSTIGKEKIKLEQLVEEINDNLDSLF